MTLTKSDIVEKLYEQGLLSKKESVEVVDTFIGIAKESLAQGNDLLLSGFGKFSVKDKKSRKGMNPQTGESMMLAPRKVVSFKSSGVLRDRVNATKEG